MVCDGAPVRFIPDTHQKMQDPAVLPQGNGVFPARDIDFVTPPGCFRLGNSNHFRHCPLDGREVFTDLLDSPKVPLSPIHQKKVRHFPL